MHESLMNASAKNSWIKRALGSWAKSVAAAHFNKIREGKGNNESLQYKLAKKIVLR